VAFVTVEISYTGENLEADQSSRLSGDNMMRLLSLFLVLLLLSGCQRYTIGAANAAPQIVSGNTDVRVEDSLVAQDTAHSETSQETDHGDASLDEAAHSETDQSETEHGETEHSETEHSETEHSETVHSAALPEVDSAVAAVQEAFAHVRGSRLARHEAAEGLETARMTLEKLAETGAISHWESLNEYFETAVEKVTEGTNDAPNALNHLLEKLEKAGHH
jgi:hypothetical protein